MEAATHVIVVGAGVGGLVAAIDLARQGLRVTVLDRACVVGGKLRQSTLGDARIDAGPTVFTLRHVFDELFADCGTALDDHVTLTPLDVLARHAWKAGETLDLHADIAASADAIGRFSGAADARGYRAFCARARDMYATLDRRFIRAPLPTPVSLVRTAGLAAMWRISPFDTLARALRTHFTDPRLRQLFGRYATYAGSSPFLAPATLMLIAHVEQAGVWMVQGGMVRIAAALAELARAQGVTIRTGADVARIGTGGRIDGVTLAGGEHLPADRVVANTDAAALAAGLLGAGIAGGVPRAPESGRSLSALTWAVHGATAGFDLHRHNVFFSGDEAGEFDDLFARRHLPRDPTVYVCAQDRGEGPDTPARDRLLCLVNAPASGHPLTDAEIAQCRQTSFTSLARMGLSIDRQAPMETTTPAQFHARYPGTGGALYGQAVHGPMASFRRPGSRSRIPGLYLAGGSTHPGAGVPMAALSGRLAAAALMADLASTSRSAKTAMSGGISTPSATTAATPAP